MLISQVIECVLLTDCTGKSGCIVRQKIELHSKPHSLTDCIPCPTAYTVVNSARKSLSTIAHIPPLRPGSGVRALVGKSECRSSNLD